MKQKANDQMITKENKKKLIVTSAAAVALLIILLLLNSIDFDSIDISSLLGNNGKDESKTIYFVEPDFEENIFEDEAYMSKNRFINYTEGQFTTVLTEKFNDYGEIGDFWIDYFDAVINGDSEAYNSFFSAAYLDENDAKKTFTMQKVYDIEVVLLDRVALNTTDEYNGLWQYKYKVGYKIMHNNGTFRDDLPSDTVIPLIFELLSDGESCEINSISEIKYKK